MQYVLFSAQEPPTDFHLFFVSSSKTPLLIGESRVGLATIGILLGQRILHGDVPVAKTLWKFTNTRTSTVRDTLTLL